MKQSRRILRGVIRSSLVVVMFFGLLMFLIEFRDLIIVPKETWQWAGWHPWIIIAWFFWMYLAIGIDIGVTLKKEGSCVYFQIPLMGISWLPLLVWTCWQDFQEEMDHMISG